MKVRARQNRNGMRKGDCNLTKLLRRTSGEASTIDISQEEEDRQPAADLSDHDTYGCARMEAQIVRRISGDVCLSAA
jgi:hypothetical protein